ncbi:MAG: hypothetical protein ACI9C4_001276 [Paraglaciecola sp.]
MVIKTSKKTQKANSGQLNSVQLNIITFVDVYKALENHSLDECVYITDNSLNSLHEGTDKLRTTCKQGQVLNWIIYPLDMDKRLDKRLGKQWPSMPKINNIVFLNEQGENVSELKVCTEFKIYGAPDKIRTEYDPVYYYWAGTVLPDLPPGVYKYRLIIELQPVKEGGAPIYLNLDTPSLQVIGL